jgi:hypothetical protein
MTTRLDAIAASAQGNLDTAGVSYATGAEHLEGQHSPPYAVWVAQEKVVHVGGGDVIGGEDDGGNFLRQILTRRIPIDVHIWAAGYAEAELLVLDYIAAIWQAVGTSAHWAGEVWPKQQAHQLLKRGEPVILKLTVDTPALDRLVEVAPIDTVETYAQELVEDIDRVDLSQSTESTSAVAADLTVTMP